MILINRYEIHRMDILKGTSELGDPYEDIWDLIHRSRGRVLSHFLVISTPKCPDIRNISLIRVFIINNPEMGPCWCHETLRSHLPS